MKKNFAVIALLTVTAFGATTTAASAVTDESPEPTTVKVNNGKALGKYKNQTGGGITIQRIDWM